MLRPVHRREDIALRTEVKARVVGPTVVPGEMFERMVKVARERGVLSNKFVLL